MKGNNIIQEDTCVHQRMPLIYTLNKNVLYLGVTNMNNRKILLWCKQ